MAAIFCRFDVCFTSMDSANKGYSCLNAFTGVSIAAFMLAVPIVQMVIKNKKERKTREPIKEVHCFLKSNE
jgi:hypothetical protein